MKRTCLWSIGSALAAFKPYALMSRKDFEFHGKTAEKYVNKRGEIAYKGTSMLKSTQNLASMVHCGAKSRVFSQRLNFVLTWMCPTKGVYTSVCLLRRSTHPALQ